MWTIPATMQVTSQAKLRIRSLQDSSLQGTSSGSFQIAPAGRDFYINDNSTVGDTFTVATGADDNHGKSPNQPMQTLAALLDNYDLDPGDVIHVDNGTYIALQSVKVRNDDSGVKIEGPASGTATITRDYSLERAGSAASGNAVDENYAFEFLGADDVTLDRLAITGANYGIYIAQGVNSDRLTITRNQIYGNRWAGIDLEPSNDDAIVSGNLFYGVPAALRGTIRSMVYSCKTTTHLSLRISYEIIRVRAFMSLEAAVVTWCRPMMFSVMRSEFGRSPVVHSAWKSREISSMTIVPRASTLSVGRM